VVKFYKAELGTNEDDGVRHPRLPTTQPRKHRCGVS
jgi:hypothetical protein